VIKSRRLRWAGHVARIGERTGAYRALVGKSVEQRMEVAGKIPVRNLKAVQKGRK
jgi:hypothetical protein